MPENECEIRTHGYADGRVAFYCPVHSAVIARLASGASVEPALIMVQRHLKTPKSSPAEPWPERFTWSGTFSDPSRWRWGGTVEPFRVTSPGAVTKAYVDSSLDVQRTHIDVDN